MGLAARRRYCLVVTITRESGRVLGCLIEKQLTTPQQYPLTANALLLACNQTTNRDPVVILDDETVLGTLGALKEQHLVRFVLPSHGRSVTRYRHVVDEVYAIDIQSLALLAVLLLRGPQTPGELRGRAERMAAFEAVDAVHDHLENLATHPEGLVRLLPRRPGQKEDRWQQLLAEQWADSSDPKPGVETSPFEARSEQQDAIGNDRPLSAEVSGAGHQALQAVRAEVADLRADVSALRASLAELDASVAALRRSLGD